MVDLWLIRSVLDLCSICGGFMMQASLMNEREVVQKAGKERINDFLRNHVCYDLLKHSGKVSLA